MQYDLGAFCVQMLAASLDEETHVLQCVAVCCSILQYFAVFYSVLQCVAVCCRVLQCFTVRCSVLQCIAVCCHRQRADY